MNTNPNQSKRIIAYIRACGNITALDALNAIGCLNLKARIHEMRRAGWGIETVFITTPSGKRVARYSLTDPAQATPTGIPQPGRKAKLPTSAIIAQVERELEHARAGVDWKEGARWALEQVKKRQ
jgi:hypothetical protein